MMIIRVCHLNMSHQSATKCHSAKVIIYFSTIISDSYVAKKILFYLFFDLNLVSCLFVCLCVFFYVCTYLCMYVLMYVCI